MKVEATPSQTVGPFFGFALPFEAGAETVDGGAPGALRIEGRMLDGDDDPVPDGLLEVWQGDQFARCRTDAEGRFHFTVRRPQQAPGADGPPQAPHLNVTIFARGLLKHLLTRVYFSDEAAANAVDPVLGLVEEDRRQTLVARDEGGVMRFDIHLQGEQETVFFVL